MPYVAPNNPLDSTLSSWTQVSANFADLRAYLNAVPVADVAARAVRREHVVAPIVRGYPHDRMESEAQIRAGHGFGQLVTPGTLEETWGSRVERLTVVPRYVDPVAYLAVGWTLYVPDAWGLSRQFEIQVRGSAHVRGDPFLAATQYPTGAGAGAKAGRLEVRRRDRVTSTWSTFPAGASDLYSEDYGGAGVAGVRGDPWRCVYVGDLVAGRVYDLVLTYVRDTAPDGIDQIDLSEISASLALS